MSYILPMTDGQKLVAQIMKVVHQPHWKRIIPETWNPNRPILYYEETNFKGVPYQVPVFVLRTNPCLWFVQGGCVMCNYMIEAGDKEKSINGKHILNQVDWIIDFLGDLSSYPYIVVTTAGSFLSNYEIDRETRLEVLNKLWKAGLPRISFESEAKYCTDNKILNEIRENFGGEISIGIGMESSDPYIRNVCLNKGLSPRTLNLATNALDISGINFYNYILLGKPFLTEDEDVSDAISSIEFAIDNGAFMVVMLMVNIQPYTLIHWLWERNLYHPPSLWSAIDVLKALPEQYRKHVTIKGIDKAVPSPLAFAQGCSLCTNRLLLALKSWNLNRNFQELISSCETCSCHLDKISIKSKSSSNLRRARISLNIQNVAYELGISPKSMEENIQ